MLGLGIHMNLSLESKNTYPFHGTVNNSNLLGYFIFLRTNNIPTLN